MNRRQIIRAAAAPAAAAICPRPGAAQTAARASKAVSYKSFFAVAKDGTRLFFQDWGSGRPVVLLSAWTFNSDVWGSHIEALIPQGFRCIAVDRRGHGRSEVSSAGYDANTLADDVATVLEHLDLNDVVLVAHSMGSVEAIRYCARHGMHRVARIMLAAPITPFLTLTSENTDGIPQAVIEAQNQSVAKDYPRWIAENEGPFFTVDTVQETRNWIKNMMLSVPLPVALACRRTMAATDIRADLQKITRPTLIVHGDKDASVPLAMGGAKIARLIENSRLIVYPGAPHGIVLTHRERFISDLTNFIGS